MAPPAQSTEDVEILLSYIDWSADGTGKARICISCSRPALLLTAIRTSFEPNMTMRRSAAASCASRYCTVRSNPTIHSSARSTLGPLSGMTLGLRWPREQVTLSHSPKQSCGVRRLLGNHFRMRVEPQSSELDALEAGNGTPAFDRWGKESLTMGTNATSDDVMNYYQQSTELATTDRDQANDDSGEDF